MYLLGTPGHNHDEDDDDEVDAVDDDGGEVVARIHTCPSSALLVITMMKRRG